MGLSQHSCAMQGMRCVALVVVVLLLAGTVDADHYDSNVDSSPPFGSESLCRFINATLSDKTTVEENVGKGAPKEFHCKASKYEAGHLIELYEGKYAKDLPLYANCESFFLFEALPMLLPGENMWSQAARGGLYLCCLLYVFLGVAIVADVFMNAIETVTSATTTKIVVDAEGKEEEVTEKVWNDTVANLSLMALGSSAPEILLSVIGVVTGPLGAEADALGPGCIVGSAAFNLLFITAVCVIAPCPRVSKVHQFKVFLITAFFAVEAYIWLLIIIEFSSPEKIELWEAVVTLLHFPLLIALAYGQDREWQFGDKVTPSDLERNQSVIGKMDNSYLAFRRDAVRFISAGRRVIWVDKSGRTKLQIGRPTAIAKQKSDITSDPYIVLKLGKDVFKTKWKKRDLNPTWDEKFVFQAVKVSESLSIQAFDHDDVSLDDFMGQSKITLAQLMPDTPHDTWTQLSSKANVEGGRGSVHVTLTLKGGTDLEVHVIEAKSLVGMDKESELMNDYAERLASAKSRMKERYASNIEMWKAMKLDWYYQFRDAIIPSGDKDENGEDTEPSVTDLVMHCLTFFWKLLFAVIPPANYFGGWLAFYVAITVIGIITAVVGEIAALFGCVVGLKKAVTAITFVALGTSLPDTFASKAAAMQEKHADAAIGNITGSNGVNVFLGIGLPWTIAALYAVANGEDFIARSCGFGLSVTVYVVFAVVTLATLIARRFILGGELGGDKSICKATGVLMVSMWFTYIIVSSLRYYDKIDDMWSIESTSLAPGGLSEWRDANPGLKWPGTFNYLNGVDMCAG